MNKSILYQPKRNVLVLNGKYINNLVPVGHESTTKIPIMQMNEGAWKKINMQSIRRRIHTKDSNLTNISNLK